MDQSSIDPTDTTEAWYTERLTTRASAPWKRLVPNPYRRNLRRMRLGRVLDVGCGVGRCLGFLDGRGVGIDHNPTSVAQCRARGFEAYTPEEFASGEHAPFDALLLSHVLEHLDETQGRELVAEHLPRLRPGGRVVLITPQAAGQRSDPTHVRYVDAAASSALLEQLGLTVVERRSFPFPAPVGRFFVHNETIVIGTLSDASEAAD